MCVFMYVMHAVCGCLYWKGNAERLNLPQLNVSALFLKAEVSGHTQVHSPVSLGSNAVESNTTARSYSRSGEGWGGVLNGRGFAQRESGVRGFRNI